MSASGKNHTKNKSETPLFSVRLNKIIEKNQQLLRSKFTGIIRSRLFFIQLPEKNEDQLNIREYLMLKTGSHPRVPTNCIPTACGPLSLCRLYQCIED